VIELKANGTLNRRFGRGGRLRLTSADGLHFQLASIAFDSRGRLLVAGTTWQSQGMPGPPDFPGPPRSWATVRRFLPNGQPDRGFGVNGTLETDFGLPAPVGGPVSSGSTFPSRAFHYEAPSILVTGIAVDAKNRPLVTGAEVSEVASCYSGLRDLTGGYVARLSPQGDADPGFGANGTVLDTAAIRVEEPMIDRSGRLIYTGAITDLCGHGGVEETEVVALGSNGQTDPSFGAGGRVQIEAFEPKSSAIDSRGRILLLAQDTYFQGRPTHNLVLRLNPHGGADPTFGHNGRASFPLPHNTMISALGVDGRDRPLLVGVARQGATRPSRFLVVRVTKGGKIDRGFGRNGSVVTGFRRKAGARANQVVVDGRGRLLVSGTFGDPRYFFPTGVALARYAAGG
jgi:uncharacterized delta-60 repeat protein